LGTLWESVAVMICTSLQAAPTSFCDLQKLGSKKSFTEFDLQKTSRDSYRA
jgi:hypothetical protein